jgi:hypothetical protein
MFTLSATVSPQWIDSVSEPTYLRANFMRKILLALLLVGLACGASPERCHASDEGWKAVGVRAGFTAIHRNVSLQQYEAFTTYGLPWSLRADSGWGAALQVNAALGGLHGAGETGLIGSIGPGVVFDKAGKGLAFDLGGDLNALSRYKFGTVDLNGNLLFEGHIGVAYRFLSGLGISYRFQHMSNGGLGSIGDGNTGLDMHMFGVSWNF